MFLETVSKKTLELLQGDFEHFYQKSVNIDIPLFKGKKQAA